MNPIVQCGKVMIRKHGVLYLFAVLMNTILVSGTDATSIFPEYKFPDGEVVWFAGTSTTLVTIWGDGRVRTWDLSTSKTLVSFQLSPRVHMRFDHYYLGKGDPLVLAVYYDGLLEMYDCARGVKMAEVQASYPCGFDGNGRQFLFLDDNRLKWLNLGTRETGTSATLLTPSIVMIDRRSSRYVVAGRNSYYQIVDQNKIIASVATKNMGNTVPISRQPVTDYFIFFEDKYLCFWPVDLVHPRWHIMVAERTPFAVAPDGSAVAYWNSGQLQIEWVASRCPRRSVPMPFRPDLEMAIDGTCVFAVPELRDIPLDPPNALFRCLRDHHAVTIIQMKHDGAVSTFPLRKF